jgi:hypothetical protein
MSTQQQVRSPDERRRHELLTKGHKQLRVVQATALLLEEPAEANRGRLGQVWTLKSARSVLRKIVSRSGRIHLIRCLKF